MGSNARVRVGDSTNVVARKETATPGSSDRRKFNGRPRGSPNKHGKLLKDAIILAAEELGDMEVGYRYNKKGHIWKKGKGGLLGYLKWMGRNEPKAFATLLSRVIPFHMVAEHEHQHKFNNVEELMERLNALGIDFERLFPGRSLPTTLELTAQDVTPTPRDDDDDEGDEEE